MPTTKIDKKKAARKANEMKGKGAPPRKASGSLRSARPLRSRPRSSDQGAAHRLRATAQATSTRLADAFRRGQDDRTQWYEQHIRDNFIDGRAGTKWFSQRMPQHLRDMHSTLAETIAHYVEELERKANLWDKRADLLQEEQGKLKAGEYVVALESWGWYDKGLVYEVMKNPLSESGISMKRHGKGVNSYHEDYRNRFRYANANEIDAFKAEEIESSAYGERDGLEEGDACDCDGSDVDHMRELLGYEKSAPAQYHIVMWICGELRRYVSISAAVNVIGDGKINWISFPVFKKLLIKTIDKRRNEQKFKFGDRVRRREDGDKWIVHYMLPATTTYRLIDEASEKACYAYAYELTLVENGAD